MWLLGDYWGELGEVEVAVLGRWRQDRGHWQVEEIYEYHLSSWCEKCWGYRFVILLGYCKNSRPPLVDNPLHRIRWHHYIKVFCYNSFFTSFYNLASFWGLRWVKCLSFDTKDLNGGNVEIFNFVFQGVSLSLGLIRHPVFCPFQVHFTLLTCNACLFLQLTYKVTTLPYP